MSCYFFFLICFSFMYSSDKPNSLSLSGSVLNYDFPHVRYDYEQKTLYCGPQNATVPLFPGLQDAVWIGGGKNLLLLRSFCGNRTTFMLMADSKELNSFSSQDNTQLEDNQKCIVGGWGVDTKFDRILIAWLEFLITAKDKNQSINRMDSLALIEMLEKSPNAFNPVRVDLKIFDINPKSFANKALIAQSPMSFAIEGFPLSSRVQLFPDKILFSPDSKYVLMQTYCGFVLQFIVPIYPLKASEVFSFPDNTDISDEKNILQKFTIKWISDKQFWFLAYTSMVTKFLRYSKHGSAWWSDALSDSLVASINDKVQSLSEQKKQLLRLRFNHCPDNNTLIELFGRFNGLAQEQSLEAIPIER